MVRIGYGLKKKAEKRHAVLIRIVIIFRG